jgi:hypothetical protein
MTAGDSSHFEKRTHSNLVTFRYENGTRVHLTPRINAELFNAVGSVAWAVATGRIRVFFVTFGKMGG